MTKEEYDIDNDGKIDSFTYYTYDANGNNTQIKSYDIGKVQYFTYDLNGNITKHEYDNNIEYYTYDAYGNNTSIRYDYNDGKIKMVRYFIYDVNGKMTKEEYDSDNNGTIDQVIYYTWQLI
jgi:hypothetical protein